MIVDHPVVTDQRDVAYLREHFTTLSDACTRAWKTVDVTIREIDARLRPQPSYVLADGTSYVPKDYFELELDRERFLRRLLSAYDSLGVQPGEEALEEAWGGLLSGVYSVCLRNATPENIARKNVLLSKVEDSIARPEPSNEEWRASLARAVDELDRLEQPFSPVLDRERFGKPPTRDSHIAEVRKRFLNDSLKTP